MRIHYYRRVLNFGDDLNRWLWEALLPGHWDPDDGVQFSGIGTIVNSRMSEGGPWIVFTSGVGYGPLPARRHGTWHFVAVRGPLSARALRLPATAAVTDGAALLATLPQYAPLPEHERNGVVFVPHHGIEPYGRWQDVCARAGIEFLSPSQDSRIVVARIRQARLVLADAMHAAITADTLRVPWIPIVTSPQISTFKWLDWTASLDLPYRPAHVPASTLRSSLHIATLRARSQRHAFRVEGTERDTIFAEALAHFEWRRIQRQSPGREVLMRGGRIAHRLLDGLACSAPLRERIASADEKRIEHAAAALATAARSESFLSDDRVYRSRLDELITRLETIPTLSARLAGRPESVVTPPAQRAYAG